MHNRFEKMVICISENVATDIKKYNNDRTYKNARFDLVHIFYCVKYFRTQAFGPVFSEKRKQNRIFCRYNRKYR